MKLIHKATGFVVAEIRGQTLQIKDPFLSKELQLKGITIPTSLRDKFDGKPIVRIGESLFARAFKEVYLRINMHESSYEWQNEKIEE